VWPPLTGVLSQRTAGLFFSTGLGNGNATRWGAITGTGRANGKGSTCGASSPDSSCHKPLSMASIKPNTTASTNTIITFTTSPYQYF
jgi:hypothetical protein